MTVVDTLFFFEINSVSEYRIQLRLNYFAFLYDEMKNYLSLMVQAYDFIYSEQFKRHGSFRDTVNVKNYISKAEEDLYSLF